MMNVSQPKPENRAARAFDAVQDGVAHIAKRLLLLRGKAPENAHRPPLKLLVAELREVASPIKRMFQPPVPVELAEEPRIVILLPGFATNPLRMRYLAKQLERAGHKVKRWKLGYNYGPSPEKFERLSKRVCEVHARYGQKVYLIGWSLGGIFAREMAKRHPDSVAKVITMGSPFSHTPYSNNGWRLYQLVTGHSVEAPPVEAQISVKPPVETVALWSPRDGVVSHRSAAGLPGERDRAIALRCTHLGFCNAPDVIRTLLRELTSE